MRRMALRLHEAVGLRAEERLVLGRLLACMSNGKRALPLRMMEAAEGGWCRGCVR